MTKKKSPKKLLILAFLAIIIFGIIPKISLAQNSPPPSNPPTPPVGSLPLPTLPTNPQPSPAPLPPANTKPQDISTNPLNCDWPGNWGGCALYWVIRAINWIMGLFIALGAVLVGFGLDLSHDLVNQNMVQAGFSVSLSIANLGFVLAIIIVALATILRRDTYGIKQLLWKIIVAAVLVNFGLVIAGTILGFSDTMSSYFTKPFGWSGQGPGSYKFVNKLTAALSPNVFLVPPVADKTDAQKEYEECIKKYDGLVSLTPAGSAAIHGCVNLAKVKGYDPQNSGWDSFVKLILAMVFIIITDFIIALTLMALAVMLIIRFVTLGILLIIMPLAWLLWIFPQYSSHFKQWWNTFLKWVFFPTIVTFFLFLAVQTVGMAGSQSQGNQPNPNFPPTAEVAATAVAAQTNQPTFVPALLNLIMVVGLSLGGLFAANKMGIVGASVAMGAAQSVGKGVKGYAARQSRKVGGAALQKVATKERLEAMGRSRIPGAGMLARGTFALKEKGRKAAMDEAAQKASKLSPEQNRFNLSTYSPKTSMDKIMGTLSVIAKDPKELEKVQNVGGTSLTKFLAENKPDFDNYGSGGLHKNITETTGLTERTDKATKEVVAAQKAVDEGEKQGIAAPEMDKRKAKLASAQEELQNASAEVLRKNASVADTYFRSDNEINEKAQKKALAYGQNKEEFTAKREAFHKAAINGGLTPNQFSNLISNLRNPAEMTALQATLKKMYDANGKNNDPLKYMTKQMVSAFQNSVWAANLGVVTAIKDVGIDINRNIDNEETSAPTHPQQKTINIVETQGGGKQPVPRAQNFTIPDDNNPKK